MLAEKAYQEGTGARGLVSSIEKALLKFEKKLPSTDIRRFVVTKQTVENPERELNKLITDPNNEKMLARYEELLLLEKSDKMKSLKKREKEFLSKYGVNLTNNRIDLIVDRAIDKRVDINAILEEVLLTIRKVKEFEEQFLNKHSFKITFSDEASDKIAKNSIESSKEVFDVCTEILKNYEHGVKLIKEKTGANELLITEEAVDDPEGYLNKLIRDSYIN